MLILLSQAAIAGPPGQRPFDDPAPREQDKALGLRRPHDDLQLHPEPLAEPGDEVPPIPLVGPQFKQAGQVREELREQRPPAFLLRPVGGHHEHP
jgi:hypothetical protein